MTAPMTDAQLAAIEAAKFTTGINAATGHFDTPAEQELYDLAAQNWNAKNALLAEVKRLRSEVGGAHRDAYFAATAGLRLHAAWRSARRRANRHGHLLSQWKPEAERLRAKLHAAADSVEALHPAVYEDAGQRTADGILRAAAHLRTMADTDDNGRPTVAALPRRGDQVEAWLKAQRDLCIGHASTYAAVDGLLDEYRLHADTGTPLGEHACEPFCDCRS